MDGALITQIVFIYAARRSCTYCIIYVVAAHNASLIFLKGFYNELIYNYSRIVQSLN
jgi:hypothetical protein